MFETTNRDGVTIIRASGELERNELAALAALARRAREAGDRVVIDLARVTHLHYAGAALLKTVPGVRAAGATPYVRDLVHAGGAGGHVELFDDVDDAFQAA
jgi:ABC-type transporter Mla MlaB component